MFIPKMDPKLFVYNPNDSDGMFVDTIWAQQVLTHTLVSHNPCIHIYIYTFWYDERINIHIYTDTF